MTRNPSAKANDHSRHHESPNNNTKFARLGLWMVIGSPIAIVALLALRL